MRRRLSAALAAIACSIAFATTSVRAQAPAGPAAAVSAASSPTLSRSMPLRREEAPGSSPSAGFAAAALLVALLAAGTFLLLRRGSPQALRRWGIVRPGATGGIARLASQPLTPQASVHVVRWSDEEFLLACTAQQVTVLARRPSGPAPGDGA